ncbi:MAG: hypothetical protein ACKPE3_10925, partial [Sphaerospermopsis kisseleviana]
QKLLTLIDGGVQTEIKKTEPEIKKPEPEIKKTEPEIKKPEPEIKKPEPEINKLEEMIKALKLAINSVSASELKQITYHLSRNQYDRTSRYFRDEFNKNPYTALENYLESASEYDLKVLIFRFLMINPQSKEHFTVIDYSVHIESIFPVDYENIPIESLDLSSKVHDACVRSRCTNIGYLLGQMRWSNGRYLKVGTSGLSQIRKKLTKLGIVFDVDAATA